MEHVDTISIAFYFLLYQAQLACEIVLNVLNISLINLAHIVSLFLLDQHVLVLQPSELLLVVHSKSSRLLPIQLVQGTYYLLLLPLIFFSKPLLALHLYKQLLSESVLLGLSDFN